MIDALSSASWMAFRLRIPEKPNEPETGSNPAVSVDASSKGQREKTCWLMDHHPKEAAEKRNAVCHLDMCSILSGYMNNDLL